MRKILAIVLAGILSVSLTSTSFAGTTQVDALIEKLVDKGILTRSEGINLKGEIAGDEKLFQKERMKEMLPKWVQKIKLKGDFRLRFQKQKKAEQDDRHARMRGRIRFRLGVEAKINKNFKVGAGLATGGSDPRSTNQTLENTFDTPDIRLDYAYVEYAEKFFGNKVKIIGGKFKRKKYLWTPTDLLWDGDINPEGTSFHAERKLSKKLKAYFNGGVWILDDINESSPKTNGADLQRSDPFMHYGQVGVKYKDKSSGVDFQMAATKYAFNAIQDHCLDNTAETNTGSSVDSNGNCTGGLKHDYDAAAGSAEIGLANPFNIDQIQRLAIFGDFVKNLDFIQNRIGWAGGLKFGHKKVKKGGQWQFKYIYAWLERDAFPDTFPDSDRYGGKTNAKGHEWIMKYGLAKNVVLGVDVYLTDIIKGSSKNPETLIQGDLVVKF